MRILALGYHVPGTGFTRVLRSVFERLAPRYDVHYLGIGYAGPVRRDVFTLHPCNPRGGDAWGIAGLRGLIETLSPQVVFVFHDLAFMPGYLDALAPYRGRCAIVAHFPLDGRIKDPLPLGALRQADCVVVYTEGSRRELRRAAVAAGVELPTIEVVPHGLDTASFRPSAPLADQLRPGGRQAARSAVYPGEPQLADGFVVLNANRPNRRKRIDLTLRGFALFARDKPPNVRLHLHHAVITSEERAGILGLVAECGLGPRFHLTPEPGGGVASDRLLNDIYNAADVGLNTSMGEGWGLVSFEHAATGAAQVVPRHSACAELWEGCAELVDAPSVVEAPFTPLEHREVSTSGVADALERLYRDPQRLSELSLAAHRNATRPDRSWDGAAELWDGLFVRLAARAS